MNLISVQNTAILMRTTKDMKSSQLFSSGFDFHLSLNVDTGIKQN